MTCVFPADWGCCSGWSDYPLEVRAAALVSASDLLWRLTGRVFSGIPLSSAFPDENAELVELGYTLDGCSTILRPCRQHAPARCDTCGPVGGWTYGVAPWIPYLDGGQWYNAPSCACPGGCECGNAADKLELPGPVAKVNAVYIDGAAFDGWALYNSNTLVRTDGAGPWPSCQDLTKDLTEAGTWAVDYVRGVPWPVSGKRPVGVLACEFARLCSGDKRCRIPANVVSVTREGVSYDLDVSAFLDKGLTGIVPEVDLFISSVNPGHNRRPSGVYTPHTVTARDWQRRQPGEVLP